MQAKDFSESDPPGNKTRTSLRVGKLLYQRSASGGQGILKGIRLHSSIENGLHWTKDVLFKEDECRTRMGNGAANLSLLRSFAISVLARTGSTISRMMRMVNNKPEKIAGVLE